MRLSIVGAGYVGLVTGACFSDRGHDVTLADLDAGKVAAIESGAPPIHEPQLADVVRRNVGVRLRATTQVSAAVARSDVTLVAVGTPDGDSGIDLSQIEGVARQVGAALRDKPEYHVVVVKSTVVPGTTDDLVRPLLEASSGRTAGLNLGVGVNPEFLTEGQAVQDFLHPDRIVLGANDHRVHEILSSLYADFPNSVPRLVTSTKTAETIKYASNALLAASISFANELADFCEAVGDVDIVDVMRGVHLSQYLTATLPGGETVTAGLSDYLQAGCGFGGSCLPKDVRALVAEAERHGRHMPVLRGVLATNASRPPALLARISKELGGLEGKRVSVLGLAFKPDTDDVRESPAMPVVAGLASAGAVVTTHDPVVHELPDELRALGVTVVEELDAALAGAEAIVIVTRWRDYERVPELVQALDPQPVVVDGRRMLEPRSVARYAGVGR